MSEIYVMALIVGFLIGLGAGLSWSSHWNNEDWQQPAPKCPRCKFPLKRIQFDGEKQMRWWCFNCETKHKKPRSLYTGGKT